MLILVLVIGACQPVSSEPAVEEIAAAVKAAFVYKRTIDDLGWTYAHDQGRIYLEKNFWGADYVMFAEQVRDATWESGHFWPGMDNGIVGLAEISPSVPAEAATLIAEKQDASVSGETKVVCGALSGQNGVQFLDEGQ